MSLRPDIVPTISCKSLCERVSEFSFSGVQDATNFLVIHPASKCVFGVICVLSLQLICAGSKSTMVNYSSNDCQATCAQLP